MPFANAPHPRNPVDAASDIRPMTTGLVSAMRKRGGEGPPFSQWVEAPALAKRRLLPYFGQQDVLSPGPGKRLQNYRRLRK